MLKVPPRWNPSVAPLAGVSRGPSVLMLDYDGTLAPFHPDRLRALPWPGVVERLERLQRLEPVRLALITGRAARELRAMLPMAAPIEIWGSHGREHLAADGTYSLSKLAPAEEAVLDRLERRLSDAGFRDQVERKPASLAAHWRSLPASDAQRIEQITRQSFAEGGERNGLRLLDFDGGLEVRSESLHKGDAVLHMLTLHPTAAAGYLGDDTTDEDAFAAMRGRGVTALVREQPRPSQAACWLQPPGDLLTFLDAWIAAAERAPA